MSLLTASLSGTGMDKLGWYPLQQFFRQPLLKRRWEMWLCYSLTSEMLSSPLSHWFFSSILSTCSCGRGSLWTHRQDTGKNCSITVLPSAHVATEHGPAQHTSSKSHQASCHCHGGTKIHILSFLIWSCTCTLVTICFRFQKPSRFFLEGWHLFSEYLLKDERQILLFKKK